MILCDTNVIIETLKGDDKTIKIMESIWGEISGT